MTLSISPDVLHVSMVHRQLPTRVNNILRKQQDAYIET